MSVLFVNNYTTVTSASVVSTDTVINVVQALPVSLGAGDYCYLTLAAFSGSVETVREVVKVTGVSGNDLTVIRGQDNTTAMNWVAGTIIEMRLVSQYFNNDVVTLDSVDTLTNKTLVNALGNVANADKLSTSRTISATGDVTYTTTFDGSGDVTGTATLADSGVTAGTYQDATHVVPVTVDAKGRITTVGAPVLITPAFADVTGKPTTVSGYGITDAYTKVETDSVAMSMAIALG